MIGFDKGQVFLVTGASSGIGKGTALQLNELGATVVAIARRVERLKALQSKAKFPENIHIEPKDLTEDIEGLPNYVTFLKKKYGKLQGMAYCAGIVDVKPLQLLDFTELQSLYGINLFAPVFMAKGFGDKRNNVGRGASMVFISSLAAYISDRAMTAYAGSKAGLSASIKAVARELAPYGIRANCILPSDIKTSMVDTGLNDECRFAKYPMGIGDVSDVSNLVMFLLSDKAKWITAQNYVVDCGSV